jgi:uncharacterized protein
MDILNREIEPFINAALDRGKSVLLLGPRQAGKTTFIEQVLKPDISLSFANAETKQQFEKDLVWRVKLLTTEIESFSSPPLVFIDEVQKIPEIMDTLQDLIDHKKTRFVLSGSSARKLKYGKHVNMLPGRVILMHLWPLSYREMPNPKPELFELLNFGALPDIILQTDTANKEIDLASYVTIYLEEEIRQEATVRNVGHFARFLQLAASESGQTINASKLSQDIGVSVVTIQSYYQILEDCLIATRIDPLIQSASNRRLIKAPSYLFFDLGVRRVASNEGANPSLETYGKLFEQYVGLEILTGLSLKKPLSKLRYWRSPDGPEVDWVIEADGKLIPIEVKLTERPRPKHLSHLKLFLSEYDNVDMAYIVCQVDRKIQLDDRITALPWQQFFDALEL